MLSTFAYKFLDGQEEASSPRQHYKSLCYAEPQPIRTRGLQGWAKLFVAGMCSGSDVKAVQYH